MNELFSGSLFFGVAVSLGGYQLGLFLKRKFKWPFLSPLLIAFLFCLAFLLLFRIDYDTYRLGAEHISYLLTPATVCLAIPLYQQLSMLKKYWPAILVGIAAGVIASAVCIWLLSLAFGLNHAQYVSLFPKSVSAAFALYITESNGGNGTIVVFTTMLTGILGNVIAGGACKLLRIKEPVAKGLAIGTSAHLMGTSKAVEMGETEGAMASLSVVVAGIFTLVCAPLFVNLI